MKQSKDKTFGQRLRTLRTAKGVSQLQLAKLAGVHNTHLSRYEKDLSHPHAQTLMRIADALGTTGDFLMHGASDEMAQDRLSDQQLLRQFQMAEQLPEPEKKLVSEFLGAFLERQQIRATLAG